MQFRDAIETDAEDLPALADQAVAASGHGDFLPRPIASSNGCLTQERQLHAAAIGLRRTWLGVAHRAGDAALERPRAGSPTLSCSAAGKPALAA